MKYALIVLTPSFGVTEVKCEGYSYWDAVKSWVESGSGNTDEIYWIYRVHEKDLEDVYGEEVYTMSSDEKDRLSENLPEESRELVWAKQGIVVYLNVYEINQHYGGSEEGGWWYDSWTPEEESCQKLFWQGPPDVDIHDALKDKTDALLAEVEKNHGPHRSRTSAAGGYDINVRAEFSPPKAGNNYSPWC